MLAAFRNMTSLEIFKLVHLFGVMVLFASFGVALGGTDTKKLSGIMHGVGGLLLLIAGFGMHGTLVSSKVLSGMPLLIILKLIIWLILGMMPLFRNRGILSPKASLFIALGLGLAAAWMGLALY